MEHRSGSRLFFATANFHLPESRGFLRTVGIWLYRPFDVNVSFLDECTEKLEAKMSESQPTCLLFRKPGSGWYQITVRNLCFGLHFKDGVCTEVAPVGRWMKGQTYETIDLYVQKHGGKWRQVTREK